MMHFLNNVNPVSDLSTEVTEALENIAGGVEESQGWLEMIREMIENADVTRFADSLSYMGVGMLGIFLVMGILIIGTGALNAIMNKFSNSSKGD